MLREEIIKGLKIATRKIGGCCDNGGWLDNEEALARKSCEEAIKLLEQETCEMTAEEYRQRMIQAFHNADCGELVALVVLPTEKEFEHLEWLLEKHYKAKPELCEDAISRQAVNILVDELARAISDERCCISRGRSTATIMQDILDLPPVTPQPKTMHEKQADSEKYQKAYDDGYEGGYAQARFDFEPKTGHWIDDKCSACGKGIEDLIASPEWYRNEKPNFCPFCGLKLVDSQESEDKE